MHGGAVQPLHVDGAKVNADEWIAAGNIDRRPVMQNRKTVIRSRPLIPAGWESTHTFELLTDVMDPKDLAPILERAGRLVGLADWRPVYGTFAAEVI